MGITSCKVAINYFVDNIMYTPDYNDVAILKRKMKKVK